MISTNFSITRLVVASYCGYDRLDHEHVGQMPLHMCYPVTWTNILVRVLYKYSFHTWAIFYIHVSHEYWIKSFSTIVATTLGIPEAFLTPGHVQSDIRQLYSEQPSEYNCASDRNWKSLRVSKSRALKKAKKTNFSWSPTTHPGTYQGKWRGAIQSDSSLNLPSRS